MEQKLINTKNKKRKVIIIFTVLILTVIVVWRSDIFELFYTKV